jgi:hypothetical protein
MKNENNIHKVIFNLIRNWGGVALLIVGVFALSSCPQAGGSTGPTPDTKVDIEKYDLSHGGTKKLLVSKTAKTFAVDKTATPIPSDAKVVYSVVTSPATEGITIDKTTGVITTPAGLQVGKTYTLKITAKVPDTNTKYTGTKVATLTISIVENLVTYKPDNTQSASRHLFTIGDVDNPYLIQIEGKGVKDAGSLKGIKLEIAGDEVAHEVKTFKSGGKTVVGIGPKEKLSFANLPAKVAITITATVGTEQVNENFTLTKAGLGDIYSWRDLNRIGDNLSGAYTLKNDMAFPTSGTYGYVGKFSSIGGSVNKFTGKLDGKNHTIGGLKIDQKVTDNAGLFSYVSGPTAEIKDLIIDHVGISGRDYVGSVAGKIDDGATITNVGMISSTNAKVSGSLAVGGLVGHAAKGTTVTGYATGHVTGRGINVGGLVGTADGATVTGYATGQVSSTGTFTGDGNVGGLVGQANGATVTGYSTGDASGRENVGGLAGYAAGATTITGYARGVVRRTLGTDTYFGKLVGAVEGAKNTISGYHSKGESRVLDEKGNTLTSHKDSAPGDPIAMGASTAQGAFSKFGFGTGDKWEWVKDGSWGVGERRVVACNKDWDHYAEG